MTVPRNESLAGQKECTQTCIGFEVVTIFATFWYFYGTSEVLLSKLTAKVNITVNFYALETILNTCEICCVKIRGSFRLPEPTYGHSHAVGDSLGVC